MALFDSLPHLLRKSKDIHGDFSFFIALKDVRFGEEKLVFPDRIVHSTGKEILCGTSYGIDFWETSPLLEDFGDVKEELEPSLRKKLANYLEIQEKDVQVRKRADGLLFSFKINEAKVNQADALCAVFEAILIYENTAPVLEIENVLWPMASVGNFDVLVRTEGDRSDLVMYNLFSGECGRLEGIFRRQRQRLTEQLAQGITAGFGKEPPRSSMGSSFLSSDSSSSMSDDVFLPHDTNPEGSSLILDCLKEMHVNTGSIDPCESFTSFGLDSLDLAELEQKISQKLGIQLPAETIQRESSLRSLSTLLAGYLPVIEKDLIKEEKMVGPLPEATPNKWQRRVILADRLEPNWRAQFNEPVSFRTTDSGLLPKLTESVLPLIMANPNLRARYTYQEKTFLSGTECYILPTRLSTDDFVEISLDIENSVPVAWNVNEDVVTLIFHHVTVDGHSLQLLMAQFKRLLAGERIPLSKSVFQEKETASDRAEEEHSSIEYSQLLRSDFPPSERKTRKAAVYKKLFPLRLHSCLKTLRSQCRCTDFDIFFAVFALILKRRTQGEGLSLGVAVSVREEDERNTVDCLVSVVPVTVVVVESEPAVDFVIGIAEKMKKVKENIRHIGTGSIQVLLVMDKVSPLDIHGVEQVDIVPAVCKYDQTWYFRRTGGEYEIVVEYCSELFIEETIKSAIDDFLLAVKNLSKNCEKEHAINSISLSKGFCALTKNRKDYPKVLVNQMAFAKSNWEFSWTCGKEQISRSELYTEVTGTSWSWEQSYLRQYGEVPTADRQIVLFLPKGLHLGVYTLACWNLGMSIVPISLDWPTERIREMVARLHNPLVVTEDVNLKKRLEKLEVAMTSPGENKNLGKTRRMPQRMSNVSLGYITCTSGSTGLPKAVCSSIRGLSNMAMNYTRTFSLNQRSKVYQVVNYAFDIFFADLCKSLVVGSSMIFAEESLPNWKELRTCTNAYVMPAVLSSLPPDIIERLNHLETLQFGGERIQPMALGRLLDTGVHLFQEFGVTEQCVYTACLRLKDGTDSSFTGILYCNMAQFVRDRQGNPLDSPGAVGELHLKGFTARGYHSMERLNRERFKDEEFASRDQVVFYKKGLKFAGRMDLQVKIMGRRIELGEIETILCQCPSVERAVVSVSEEKIYAHVRGNEDVNELKKFSARSLPFYMVPEEIFLVHEFPLNANGKIDKSRLVVPSRKDMTSLGNSPLSDSELLISQSMEKILSKKISVDECFFERGGNSVKAMLVIQLLRENGLRVDTKEFFEAKTARKIAQKLEVLPMKRDQQSIEANSQETTELSGKPEPRSIPLSHIQRRLWFIQKLTPGSDAYTFSLLFKLNDNVDQNLLSEALKQIINHNPCLRGVIVESDEGPFWKILPEIKEVCSFKSPLVNVIHTEKQLTLTFNHLVIDGRSFAILAKQLEKAYREENFECRINMRTREDDTDEAFWKQYLEDVEINNFPSREPPSFSFPHEAGRIRTSILPKLPMLHSLPKKSGLFPVLLFAVAQTMRKVYDEDDIVLGTTVANRTVEDYDTVGMFANTLPIRFKGKITLEKAEETLHVALDHQNTSLENIQKIVSGELIRCVVNYQNTSLDTFPFSFGSCLLEKSRFSQFPLSWIFAEEGKGSISLTLEYDRSIFADCDARKFCGWLLAELSQLVRPQTKRTVANGTNSNIPRTSITRILWEQSLLSTKNTALEGSDINLSYDDAFARSLQMACIMEQRILEKWARVPGGDDVVAVLLEEGLILHLTLNAILLLGCAYTVIPVSAPEERKQNMLKEVNPLLVISEEDLRTSFSRSPKIRLKSTPCNLMYVMFTSGTTGRPKGIPIAHLGTANLLTHATKLYHLRPRGRVAQFTRSHFDASVSNTFGPLVNGATLCLLDLEKEASEAVASLLPLTLLHMTPTVFDYLSADDYILERVESFSIGGEPPSIVTVHRALFNGVRLVQLYGPTEATCYQTAAVMRLGTLVSCVGSAVPNLPHGVCSWSSFFEPRSDIGQFFCGGCQLSRGYLNGTDKTHKLFVPNPYRTEEDMVLKRNKRVYLTGDRVFLGSAGKVYFIGRKDQQVKIFGHRIEIGEIEAALRRLQGIESVAVVLQEDRIGKKHIVAFYTGTLKDYSSLLTTKLFSYMLPVKIVHLEKMPITANAKLDKMALSQRKDLHQNEEAENHSSLERSVLGIYKEILADDSLGVEDNFFYHGGHSLLAVKLASRLEKTFQILLPIATVFVENTPRKMARFVEKSSTIKNDKIKEKVLYNGPSALQLPLLRLFRLLSFQEMYTNQVKVRLLKGTGQNKIRHIFKELLKHHPALRTKYRRRGKDIQAELLSEEDADSIFKAKDQLLNVFEDFPIAVSIAKDEVIIKTSHIAVDGHSMQILVRDIERLIAGEQLQPDNATEFNLYLDKLFSENNVRSLGYWGEKLVDWMPNTLMTDFPRKSPQNFESQTIARSTKGLKNIVSLARVYGVTPFVILLSAIAEALRPLLQSSHSILPVSFPVNLRTEQFENAVTMGVNTALVLIPRDLPIKDLGQAVTESIDKPITLDDLSELVGKEKRIFEVMVTFDDYTVSQTENFKVVREPEKYTKCEISFFAGLQSEEILVDYAKSLFKAETIARILDRIEETFTKWNPKSQKEVSRISPSFPLTAAQKQMFLTSYSDRRRVLPFLMRKPQKVKAERLQEILNLLVQKHETFRTVFFLSADGEPCQEILSFTECYRFIRMGKYGREHPPETVKMEENVMEVFVDDNLVVLWLHHIATDAWSTRILEKELGTFLNEEVEEIEPQKSTIRDCLGILLRKPAENELHLLSKGRTLFVQRKQCEFIWRKSFRFPKSKENLFTRVVQGLLETLDVVDSMNIGFPFANRTPKTSKLIGYFLNNLVININRKDTLEIIEGKKKRAISNNFPYFHLITACREYRKRNDPLFQVYLNCRYDLESSLPEDTELIEMLPINCEFPLEIDVDSYEKEEKITARGQGAYLDEKEFDTFTAKLQDILIGPKKFDLLQKILMISASLLKKKTAETDGFFKLGGTSLQAIELAEELEDLLGREVDMEIIYGSKSFAELAALIEKQPDTRKVPEEVSIPQLETESSAKVIIQSSPAVVYGKMKDIPRSSCHRIFGHLFTSERLMFVLPDHTAHSYSSVLITAQRRTYSLCQEYLKLTGNSLRPDDIIPVVGRKSIGNWIDCLAIQMAGAAYLPIAASTPLSKFQEIMSQLYSKLYIGETLDTNHPRLEVQSSSARIKFFNNKEIDLAYVISTSGTTGTPKTVCVQYKGLMNMAMAAVQDLRLSKGDTVYQFTSFCFDNSVLEVFSSLASSSSLFLDSSPFTPRRFARQITSHRITHCLLFPGLVGQFKDNSLLALKELKYWVTGAEKLPPSLFDRILGLGLNVIQNYGPTETTCYALMKHMKRGDLSTNLGKPVQNVIVRIIDNELLVTGQGRMRGYLNRSDSFVAEEGCNWYRTGDVIHLTEDGTCVYKGRKDGQVKIRGHRVELDEIEEKLKALEGLEQCSVRWKDPVLTAFCVSSNLMEKEIREYCEQRLPLYMRPNEIQILSKFPLTDNYKMDVKKLEKAGGIELVQFCENIIGKLLDPGKSLLEQGESTAGGIKIKRAVEERTGQAMDIECLLLDPLDKVKLKPAEESRMRKAWKLVLGHGDFNENSRFLLSGGTSLHLVRLKVELGKLGLEVPVHQLMSKQTFKEMERLDRPRSVSVLSRPAAFKRTVILVHPLYGGAAAYTSLTPLINPEDTQILAVEHPNSFSFSTEALEFFESFDSLTALYSTELKDHLEGEVILCGASIGGTLAVEIGQRLAVPPRAVVIVDTLAAPDLSAYTFEKHRTQLLTECSFADNAVLVNSWDLLQMLKRLKWTEFDLPVTLLSLDGTDLGWKRYCPRLTVLPLPEGRHSTLLSLPLVSQVAAVIRSFY